MKIGASTGTLFPDFLTEDAVDVLARLGFSTIEVLPQTFGEYLPAFSRVVAGRVRDAGISVHSVHTLHHLHDVFSPYRRRRQEGVELFAQVIEFAAMLDARCLIWHGLSLRDRDATWDDFREMLARLSDMACRAGLTLSLENVSWCRVRDRASVAQVRDWELPVGFTFDPFQAAEAGIDPVVLPGAMGNRLINVHLSDYRAGQGRHLPPGEGTLPWRKVIEAVIATGYSGPLIIEGNCRADLSRLVDAREFVSELVRREIEDSTGIQ